jgi:hypothetical protein
MGRREPGGSITGEGGQSAETRGATGLWTAPPTRDTAVFSGARIVKNSNLQNKGAQSIRNSNLILCSDVIVTDSPTSASPKLSATATPFIGTAQCARNSSVVCDATSLNCVLGTVADGRPIQ